MEYILCVAIWYKELPRLFEKIPDTHLLPININEGIVFCGHRHLQCLYTMIALTGKKQSQAGKETQG